MIKTPIEIKNDIDYLINKVNIGMSFFDAKAISIMNTYGTDLTRLQNQNLCSTCIHFGKYTLHPCDGGLTGCKKLSIENSDRKLGGCMVNWKQRPTNNNYSKKIRS